MFIKPSLNAASSHPAHQTIHSDEALDGKKKPNIEKLNLHQNTISIKSKCIITAIAVAGLVMIGLGFANIYGVMGSSSGLIGPLAIGGGAFALLAGGGTALFHYKKHANHSLEQLEAEGLSVPIEKSEFIEKHPELRELIERYHKNITPDEMTALLKKVPESFFATKSQERAKEVFTAVMRHLFQATVFFPCADTCENVKSLSGKLDQEVFQLSETKGVQQDIPLSSKDTQHVHIYQVASQYNAAEATCANTPAIGTAMSASKEDRTQGPRAQRTNPAVFECVTAFLTHLGFNMMENVLPYTGGKTYIQGDSIEHGYLRPADTTVGGITQEFEENYHKAEYVCYSSLHKDWKGSQPVYIMLQAAPALGQYSRDLTKDSDELQKYASLANHLALFRQGIAIAREKEKPVVLHANAPGGGYFDNKTKNLQWGFEKAALALQEEMKTAGVSVQLEAFNGTGPMQVMAKNLNIQTKSRIGDHN